MDEELLSLLEYLGTQVGPSEYPRIIVAYQELCDNPRGYFHGLLSKMQISSSPLSPDQFLSEAPENSPQEWSNFSSFAPLLKQNAYLHYAILVADVPLITQIMDHWRTYLHSSYVSEVAREWRKAQRVIAEEVAPDVEPKLVDLCLYFLWVSLLSIMQQESQLLTELMALNMPPLLVHYLYRLESPKHQLQVKKYMFQRLFSKLPEEFSLIETHALLDYFNEMAHLCDSEEIMQIIPQLEALPLNFRRKNKPILSLITHLSKIDATEVSAQAWKYPRLPVRNLFLPLFITIEVPGEIRRYYRSHSSTTSRHALLQALCGQTTDPYFLRILLEQFPEQRRKVVSALIMYRIHDPEGVIEFLLELPDQYSLAEVEGIFFTYWERRPQLFFSILDRLDEFYGSTQQSKKIRAKYRLVGLKF